jgi:hypothetical protein
MYKRLFLTLASLAVLGLGWVAVEKLTRPPVIEMPTALAAPGPRPATPAIGGSVTATAASAALPANPDVAASIEDKVHQLVSSRRPEHALDAYRLIRECLALERDKALTSTELKIAAVKGARHLTLATRPASESELQRMRGFCANLTGRTRLARHDYLKTAMDHFLPQALQMYIADGPMGDAQALKERPDDPQVQAWRKDALARLDAHIRRGEPGALVYADIAYGLLDAAPTPAEQYSNFLATNRVTGAIQHGSEPFTEETLHGMMQALTPEQRAQAQARADAIFDEWKRRQSQGRPDRSAGLQ